MAADVRVVDAEVQRYAFELAKVENREDGQLLARVEGEGDIKRQPRPRGDLLRLQVRLSADLNTQPMVGMRLGKTRCLKRSMPTSN